MKYNFLEIEAKWQKYWEDHQTFRTEGSSDKPKAYILDMYPYPSVRDCTSGTPKGIPQLIFFPDSSG